MKLNLNADFSGMISAIEHCRGDVYYDTSEGDHLNLKSKLSQLIFVGGVLRNTENIHGYLTCEDAEDYAYLSDWLVSAR